MTSEITANERRNTAESLLSHIPIQVGSTNAVTVGPSESKFYSSNYNAPESTVPLSLDTKASSKKPLANLPTSSDESKSVSEKQSENIGLSDHQQQPSEARNESNNPNPLPSTSYPPSTDVVKPQCAIIHPPTTPLTVSPQPSESRKFRRRTAAENNLHNRQQAIEEMSENDMQHDSKTRTSTAKSLTTKHSFASKRQQESEQPSKSQSNPNQRRVMIKLDSMDHCLSLFQSRLQLQQRKAKPLEAD